MIHVKRIHIGDLARAGKRGYGTAGLKRGTGI